MEDRLCNTHQIHQREFWDGLPGTENSGKEMLRLWRFTTVSRCHKWETHISLEYEPKLEYWGGHAARCQGQFSMDYSSVELQIWGKGEAGIYLGVDHECLQYHGGAGENESETYWTNISQGQNKLANQERTELSNSSLILLVPQILCRKLPTSQYLFLMCDSFWWATGGCQLRSYPIRYKVPSYTQTCGK